MEQENEGSVGIFYNWTHGICKICSLYINEKCKRFILLVSKKELQRERERMLDIPRKTSSIC